MDNPNKLPGRESFADHADHITRCVAASRAKLHVDQAQVAAQLLAEGKPVRDIARTFNVHEATIYR
jgi:DNA-binding NarL/FixJ family response regulator